MADEKITSDNPDAEAADQDKDRDKRAEQDQKHPGYKYYRRTRQFGG